MPLSTWFVDLFHRINQGGVDTMFFFAKSKELLVRYCEIIPLLDAEILEVAEHHVDWLA